MKFGSLAEMKKNFLYEKRDKRNRLYDFSKLDEIHNISEYEKQEIIKEIMKQLVSVNNMAFAIKFTTENNEIGYLDIDFYIDNVYKADGKFAYRFYRICGGRVTTFEHSLYDPKKMIENYSFGYWHTDLWNCFSDYYVS